MYCRQPHLPVDVTLELAPHSIMAPTTLKFMKKIQECMKWAHKKAETFQAKETQCHKQNYNLGGWGHNPSPYNCLQRVIIKYRDDGKKGNM